MKIKINEDNLRTIIRNSVKKIVEGSDMLRHGEFSNHGDNINVGQYVDLNTRNLFLKYASEIWNILQESYKKSDGLKSYHSYKDFLKKKHYAHIIIDGNNNILACETYRIMDNSLKIVAGGCLQNEIGKQALQQLIQYDIINYDLHYWAEVSGHIEHYFKKYNGFPMPSSKASEILGIPEEQIHRLDDNVHYERAIGVDGEIYTKMIFGIKNEEIFNSVIQEIENYGSFMKEVNNLNESVKQPYTLKQIIYIVENIYRAHEEDGFNELIPSWYNALIICLNELKKMDTQDKNILAYINYCEYLLDTMPVLNLNVI